MSSPVEVVHACDKKGNLPTIITSPRLYYFSFMVKRKRQRMKKRKRAPYKAQITRPKRYGYRKIVLGWCNTVWGSVGERVRSCTHNRSKAHHKRRICTRIAENSTGAWHTENRPGLLFWDGSIYSYFPHPYKMNPWCCAGQKDFLTFFLCRYFSQAFSTAPKSHLLLSDITQSAWTKLWTCII